MKIKKIAAGLTALMIMSSSLTFTSAGDSAQYKDYGSAPGGSTTMSEIPDNILYGDVNRDGSVTAKDIVDLQMFLCGKAEFSKEQFICADINQDSEVNVVDLIILKSTLLELFSQQVTIENAVAAPDMSKYKRSYIKADTADYNKFTANSAAVLFADKESTNTNPVYSPISVYMALSMLAECTDGTTLKEITDTLCADNIEDLRKSNNDIFHNLYFDVNTKENTAYCKIANSFWLNDLYTYNDDTLQTLADSYFVSSFLKNFADEKTPEQISKWINYNTSGKFSPQIRIDDPVNEVIKIINTITFKDNWAEEFNDSLKDIFHTINNEDKECEFLHKSFVGSFVEYGDGFMKTSVPMNNGYKMNFVLPDEDTTVEQIVSSPDTLLDIINKNTEAKDANVIFSVPEFNVSSRFSLIDWAKKMGINSVFTDTADFSKISDSSLAVSEITHEATIQIDEKGCEAAAYTMIEAGPTSVPDECEDVVFKLDRPFFYYVSDYNGTPVFSGIINDPVNKCNTITFK